VPGPKPRRARARPAPVGEVALARSRPVAQVMIDSSLPHLDHAFDYAVPESMSDTAVPGARVRVRFAGRLTDGFVASRHERADHVGDLRPLERVIGAEPLLTAETFALVEQVAERYAGTFSDVVRAAVPPRHARAETTVVSACEWRLDPDPGRRDRWTAYAGGGALVDRLASPDGAPTRAVWSAAPATSWTADVAALVGSVLEAPHGGVLVVVPDAADVDRLLAEVSVARAAGAVATLTADQGPERRYRQFLKVLRGGARLVIGTRAAVFAPVLDLRLIVVWDDADDALSDPQAPYWEARDVAALRSHLSGCDLVVGSPARSVQTQQWCESGWARSITATRATVSARAPRVRALQAGDEARDEAAGVARIPHQAWDVARDAVRIGPVLVQVGRRGYVPVLACQSCREVARCSCGGPLALTSGRAAPHCSWCGAIAGSWSCRACAGTRLRAVSVGAERTAEEIGRAFPGVRVLSSHGGKVLAQVPDEPSVVVATWGAEPQVDPGYQAVVILDARSQLQRPFLHASEDAARRWFAAARLAVPRAPIVVTADNALLPVQALIRWDAPGWPRRLSGAADYRRRRGWRPSSGGRGHRRGRGRLDPHRVLGPVPVATAAGDSGRQRALVVVDRARSTSPGAAGHHGGPAARARRRRPRPDRSRDI
jgi:primosomal protein N' (replication factor Y)